MKLTVRVGFGVRLGVGVGVSDGVGDGVGSGVGDGVGDGVGLHRGDLDRLFYGFIGYGCSTVVRPLTAVHPRIFGRHFRGDF